MNGSLRIIHNIIYNGIHEKKIINGRKITKKNIRGHPVDIYISNKSVRIKEIWAVE